MSTTLRRSRAEVAANYLEIVKAGIVDMLSASPFPRTMCLEDQGLFVIGYYHQRQRLFQRADTAKAHTSASKET